MKKIIVFLTSFLLASFLWGFEWPQPNAVESDKLYSYFGQLRGGTISSSLIFSEPSQINSSDKGKVSIVLTDYKDDTEFFPSTLGNCVILSHDDGFLTVYANIDSVSFSKELKESKEIESGTPLGFSGNSAWQQGHSSLEFQVIDSKKNAAINPRLLMPRIGKELPLYYGEVFLQNKDGRQFKIPLQTSISSGNYKIYRTRQNIAVPYKTRVSINGTIVDQISYDMLMQSELSLCAIGQKNYRKNTLYPNNTMHLIGELSLPPGKNTLQLSMSDILGKEVNISFPVNSY